MEGARALGGNLGGDQVNADLHFPQGVYPWGNRELFPKPDVSRAVLQIWLEMFTLQA